MRKRINTAVVLILMFSALMLLTACGNTQAPSQKQDASKESAGQETGGDASQPSAQPSQEPAEAAPQETSDEGAVEASIDEVSTLDEELDTAELDSLDQDLEGLDW
ncbi:hypothetical protein D6764_05650 [Candidatus Woesearchaeota archaeon]|nr:MAG: hypothetical protein D6764_05650 [Candidatus Woesearchaeota archaeon]